MRDGDSPSLSPEASACPGCGASLPIPVEAPAAALTVSRGRLAGAGCFVDVSEAGLFTRLRIETPAHVLYRGPEPGQRLTRKGATLLLAGPPVAAALAVAFGLLDPALGPIPAVVGLLLLALVISLLVRAAWQPARSLGDRALEYAWSRLTPRLHLPEFSFDESAFLAGLARWTQDAGRDAVPPRGLARLVEATERAVGEGRPVVRHLAALQRLAAARAAAAGEDPVPLLAAQLGRCFEDHLSPMLPRMPPCFAEELLADWHASWRTRTARARLRLLLSDRAFEAGLEVRHLVEAGRLVPALGSLLRTDDPSGLAQLRLLWSQRASRPWDKCSPAVTAFELAGGREEENVWADLPDLLLFQRVPLSRPRAGQREEDAVQGELIVCGRGLVFEGKRFTEAPPAIEVFSRGLFKRGGHRLVVGGHTFHLPDDPEPLARLLERWFQFWFRDFLPQVDEVLGWQSSAGDAVLRTWDTVACPQCRRIVRTRAGQVGIFLDEPSGTDSRAY